MLNVAIVALALCVLYLVLPVVILLLRDWWTTPSAAEYAEMSRRFQERLRTPQISVLEERFGHRFPEALCQLYADPSGLFQSDFEVVETFVDRWHIATFLPADAESIVTIGTDSTQYFEFASDAYGGTYLVDPKFDDPPVICLPDELEPEEISDHISEFLSWPRLPPSDE